MVQAMEARRPGGSAIPEVGACSATRQAEAEVRQPITVAGMTATPLKVWSREPNIFERWAGILFGPVYEISWTRQRRIRLFSRSFEWTQRSGSRFLKLNPEDLVMPVQAETRRHAVLDAPEVEETAVFEEIGVDPILAVRVGGEWYELYRWDSLVPMSRHAREPFVAGDGWYLRR